MMERLFGSLRVTGLKGLERLFFWTTRSTCITVQWKPMSLYCESKFILVDFKDCIPPPGALPDTHPDHGKEGRRPLNLVIAARKG